MVTMDKTRYPWKLHGLEYSEYSSFRMYSEKECSFASLSIRFSPNYFIALPPSLIPVRNMPGSGIGYLQ